MTSDESSRMTSPPSSVSRSERDRWLALHADAASAWRRARSAGRAEDAKSLHDAMRLARTMYFQQLPTIGVSVCPFDGSTLRRVFDPWGVDGLWWSADARPDHPSDCRHLVCLLGAMRWRGDPPRHWPHDLRTGPQCIYLIPRLLDADPSMTVILHRLDVAPGHRVTLAAYFSERPERVVRVPPEWPRRSREHVDHQEVTRWHETPADAWTFDLGPWIESGRVRWCEPDQSGVDSLRLAAGGAEPGGALVIDEPGHRVPVQVPGRNE